MAEQTSTPKPQLKGRRVRCFATGEYGTSLTFFKAPDGHYYKSEALYKQRTHDAEVYKSIMDIIHDILAFDPSMVFPTSITRSIKQLSFYGNETILETLEQCKPQLENAMRTKSFSSEYNRASYIMAVVKNHINDVYKAKKRRESAEAGIQRQERQFQAEDATNFADIGYAAKPSRDLSFFQDDDDE